jgi:outer membrane protein assembly factor BamB
MPAWPDEPRMPFDRGYAPVSDGGSVYFGSSADCKVYALDAATGRERWSFFTDGPVRFAPALWKDRLFAASDDGHLYCLATKSGELLWKKRGGPGSGRMVLGNGRMISKWPARGGPVVVDDVVYFGAGIWPADGVYVYALRAESGEQVWVNGETGSIDAAQPHRGGVRPNAAVSVQGHMAAHGDKLFVPAGRAVPAVFSRADGKLLYFNMAKNGDGNGGATGGSEAMVAGGLLLSGSACLDAGGQRVMSTFRTTSAPAAGSRHIFFPGHRRGAVWVLGIDRAKPVPDGKRGRSLVPKRIWELKPRQVRSERPSVIVAGGTLVVGASGAVFGFDIATRKQVWSQKLEGEALALAAAGGRLFVSTDQGAIHCFAAGGGGGAAAGKKPSVNPYGGGAGYGAAAAEIVKKSGISEGYCLDLGCGEGQLAFEIARRTKLQIIGVEKDPAKVAAARKKLDAAGLYGVRVTVLQGDPAKTDLPNYFADLVVSGNSVSGAAVPGKEALRCRRPCGGTLCVGKPGAVGREVRGPLKGAGDWTHQYANAANTTCSDDDLARGPLTVLWYGGPDQRVADRHTRPAAPLFAAGRVFVQGLDDIRALDAYNGRLLWVLPLESFARRYGRGPLNLMAGASVSGGNMCTDGKVLYAHKGDVCLRIDAATGKKLGELRVPPDENGDTGTWGYIALEGGTLFGSAADGSYKLTRQGLHSESKVLFAMDPVSGKAKWTYRAERSIRHNAIAVGGGAVYLIDRPVAPVDTLKAKPKRGQEPEHPAGTLLALDAASGKVKWKRPGAGRGTVLALSVKHDVLLVSGQPAGYGMYSERGSKLIALRASGGEPLYEVASGHSARPVVNDRTIYAVTGRKQTGTWDLLTGKPRGPRMVGRGSCGILAGGRHILTFRAGSLGYVDLRSPEESDNYGGARPGCWINAIPAGGLVLMPDYSDNCSCSYQIKTSLALEARE